MWLTNLIVVCIGSALGGGIRYLLSLQFPFKEGQLFSGTLLVNLLGSFLMGAAIVALQKHIGKTAFFFIAIGLLGGFTTFSSFSLEVMNLLKSGATLTALGYVLLSVLGGILLFFLGYVLATNLTA